MSERLYNINLYQKTVREGNLVFSAYGIYAISIMAFIIFIFMTNVKYRQLSAMIQQRDRADQEYTIALKEQESVKKQVLETTIDPSIDNEIEQLQTKLSKRREMLEFLTNTNFSNRKGFSKEMLAMAKVWIDGIWITSLIFADGAHGISLAGKVKNGQDLITLIRNINSTPEFESLSFSGMTMSRYDTTQPIDFTIKSKPGRGE